jgi:NTP pyrophosphatase (non-canonical NTP hydrolase)
MADLTFKTAQKKVDDWITSFEEGYWTPLSMLASITEELGELAREVNAHEGFKPKKKERSGEEIKENIGYELGDLMFSIICVANYFRIDLEDYLLKVIKKYDERDSERWTKKK